MTPSEFFKKESEEVTDRLGYYIPPYRMASLMKTAQKITDMLARADVCMTYTECKIVLDIVGRAIDRATGKENTKNA